MYKNKCVYVYVSVYAEENKFKKEIKINSMK